MEAAIKGLLNLFLKRDFLILQQVKHFTVTGSTLHYKEFKVPGHISEWPFANYQCCECGIYI